MAGQTPQDCLKKRQAILLNAVSLKPSKKPPFQVAFLLP